MNLQWRQFGADVLTNVQNNFSLYLKLEKEKKSRSRVNSKQQLGLLISKFI